MTLETLTHPEINAVERQLGHTIPGLYRKLLVEVGHGTTSSGKQIYHPTEIAELYERFFEDPRQLFAPYFPFGCDNTEQSVWIIDSERELAAEIYHETVPEDWPDETWLEYGDWVIQILDKKIETQ